MFLRRGLPHRTQAHPRFLPTSPSTSLRFMGGARATSRQHREDRQGRTGMALSSMSPNPMKKPS